MNSYPWLFPGGVGDIYDLERGQIPIKEWGQHLLRYYDGRFLEDPLFGLFLYNTIQRHTNNSKGNFFFKSDRFIGKNPPTVQELKKQLEKKNTRYIQMLRNFSRNIKGSDNFWRSRTEDLQHWIIHHVARGHGPPTFFITLSCAENWWIDLKRLLAQLEDTAHNYSRAEAIRGGSMIAMANASRRHPLFVNEYFMRRAKSFMSTVVKTALGIEHYWGRVEFAPGRGAIHLHIVAIAKDMAYLQDFYHAKTVEDKAAVVNNYAREHLDITADVDINDDKERRPEYQHSPLGKRYCESTNEDEDVRQLAEDCMCHQCNKYCLRSGKTNTIGPRKCRVHFGTETKYGKQDTQGLPRTNEARIIIDQKGISHFRMKRTKSVRVVQHSRTLLRGWRANCDIKLLLYYSNPNCPDISEIEDVSRYVVSYTGKRHNTSQAEIDAIQNIIMK